ncbi:MAG: PLP-dependent aminotransferase family protein [Myxococcales bacterium]|nr:PLP-dependent aminotransferase family protein [Myxococcales bacterium]
MQIQLERNGERDARPVYRQIADHIRGEIDARRVAAGSRLPPIRDLARRLHVNRDTVALAYEALAAAGVVESAVGRGTFVCGAGRAADGDAEVFQPALSPLTERLLDFERSRPRFGSGSGAVPMHAVFPDSSLYPVDAFRRVLNRVLIEAGPELLGYGGPQGHEGLREVVAKRLRLASIDVAANDLVLCHGASQGIALSLRLFAEPGDTVALEEPTYSNVLATVAGLGLETRAIPMREDGPDLAVLERALRRPEVKLFYTIPTFHNPLGTTSTREHRTALLEIAARCGKPVIVDAYEMDLRFAGRPVPSLAALDRAGLVVHLSSFSKSLFPGVRAGAIAARGRLVDALVALKQATDLSDAMPLQAALAEFVARGDYDRHLGRLRRILRSRCEALLEALAREMPRGARWTTPQGGYQVWVELPEGIDTSDLLADAVGAGVLFAPGAQFHHDGRPSRGLRLSFAMANEDALRRGVAALGRVVRDRLAAQPRRSARLHI